MACGGVAAICVAAVTALHTVQPVHAILARQLAFLAAPSGSARAGPIQGVAGGAVEAPAR